MTLSLQQREKIYDLLDQLFDEQLDAADHHQLSVLLESNDEALDIYLSEMNRHASLAWDWSVGVEGDSVEGGVASEEEVASGQWLVAGASGPKSQIPNPQSPIPNPLPTIVLDDSSVPPHLSPLPFYISHPFIFSNLFALLVIGLGALGAWFYQVDIPRPTARVERSAISSGKSPSVERLTFIGQITGMVDVKWADESTAASGGARVPLGRKYALTSGLMEITYDTGARVILQGPVTYEVDSRAGGFLSVGKLTAKLEKKPLASSGRPSEKVAGQPLVASGQWSVASEANPKSQIPNPQSLIPNPSSSFAVRTPTAVVTDLGTEFGVVVQPSGQIQTIVFQGVVEVQQHTGGSATSTKQRVSAGQVAMTGKHGPQIIAATNWENPVCFARTLQSSKTQEKPSDDHTIAYWRFEEGPADSSVPGQAMEGTHAESCVKDNSGNGNHVRAAQSGSSPIYRRNVPQGLTLQSIPKNRLSLEFGEGQNESPCYLYSYDDSRFARSLNYHEFAKWTIEASVRIAKFDGNRYQTFVCRERYLDAVAYSSLYLQATPERKFSIRARQSDGAYIIVDGTTQVLTDTWYHVAACSDGATLSLYVAEDGRDYRKENSLPFAGDLFIGDRFWLVGQGVWGGKLVDQMHGFIDEVRISDAALDPAQFLFAGKRK